MTPNLPPQTVSRRGFDEIRRSDVVIVGTGAAGLSAVHALRGLEVTVLSKGKIGRDGSSHYAQGGIAAALRSDDSPEAHAQDTQRVAGELSQHAAARILTQEGPGRVLDLIDLGANFDREPDGSISYGLEAGHSLSRVLHAADATGAEVMRSLVHGVSRRDHLHREEDTFAYDLVVQAGRVIGVLALAPHGTRTLHLAPSVILATGGFGQLYPYTTNPTSATGDGIAMAARAGALLSDLEFVQFHPTALAADTNPRPLLTEALRGAGATLTDREGLRFMPQIHPDAELAPRDVVARAVWQRIDAGHETYLDARKVFQEQGEHFPTVQRLAAEHGLDPASDLLPIVPAAHYAMGGIWVDGLGRTSLPGLWACGECACTGVHGANRLASNSLLEALVFGRRVGLDIRAAFETGVTHPAALVGIGTGPEKEVESQSIEEHMELPTLHRSAFSGLGIERDSVGLESAAHYFRSALQERRTERSEFTNLLLVGFLVARAALARKESRGAHARTDFPNPEEAYRDHSALRFEWRSRGPSVSVGRLAAEAPPNAASYRAAESKS